MQAKACPGLISSFILLLRLQLEVRELQSNRLNLACMTHAAQESRMGRWYRPRPKSSQRGHPKRELPRVLLKRGLSQLKLQLLPLVSRHPGLVVSSHQDSRLRCLTHRRREVRVRQGTATIHQMLDLKVDYLHLDNNRQEEMAATEAATVDGTVRQVRPLVKRNP